MRKALFCAALSVVSLAGLAMPASAATFSSDSCSAATSLRLVDNSLLGSGQNRLWIESPSTTRKIVCFDLPFGNTGGGAIVVDATPGGSLTPVLFGDDPAACPFYAIDSANPVLLRLGVNTATATVCLVTQAKIVTLTFTGSTPSTPQIEVWRDGIASALDVAACPVSYTLLLLTGVDDGCIHSNARII